MASVFDVLKLSGGSLPLNELATRSSDQPEEVARALHALEERGVVTIDGPLPADPARVREAYDTTVELSDLGALLR